MRPIAQILCTAALVAAIASPLQAQEPAPAASVHAPASAPVPAEVETAAPLPNGAHALTREDVSAWLDGFVPYALENGDVAGAVVMVVKDGQVLAEKGYGYSDLETRAPVDPEATLFRPGSVSKLFTWTALMQLVEEGKVDLDADVNKYIDFKIPELHGKPITVRNVMTHTPGIEEQIRGLITARKSEIVPLGNALKNWVPERIYVAGTTPAYSNYTAALAGYIVEKVSGQSFDDYLDAHIFKPLGMAHSSFRQPLPEALLKGMSKGYKQASDGKAQDYEFISLAPAGSLASTGSDMARFMIAHLQDGAYGDARILEAKTAQKMHSTGQASVGPLNKMMLGFYETSVNGHRAISHGGDTQWFHSDLQLFIDDGVGIFISMNSPGREGAAGQIRQALSMQFANRYFPGPPVKATQVSKSDAALHAAQMAGTYISSRRPDSNFMSIVNLLGPVKVGVNADGTISVGGVNGFGGAPKKWREIAPYVWQDTESSERMAADFDNGQVTRFSMEPYAPIMVFQRLSAWRAQSLNLMVASLAILLLTVLAWPISALVRRHYGVRYALSGGDASAHRLGRVGALLSLLAVGGALGLVAAMFAKLEMTSPDTDWMINLVRVFATVALPLGAVLSLWNAKVVVTGRRRWLAKLWALLVAASCLFLLWLGFAQHLIGYGANY